MSDFQFTADVLRGQMAEALQYADDEHVMWVLAQYAECAAPNTAVSLAGHFPTYEHDRSEVASFLRNLANQIETEGEG